MRRLFVPILAAMLLVLVALPAQAGVMAGHKWAAVSSFDWSTQVAFDKTGLDKYSAADAALLKMLEPQRIKDPTERAAYQLQLDALVQAQQQARSDGKDPRSVSSPAPVTETLVMEGGTSGLTGVSNFSVLADTMDPGCQLTSSNPDGLDLCAYDSTGDTMSVWASGRKHRMWAGLQESDNQNASGNAWRVWYKSQAYGLSSDNVDHVVNVMNWYAWKMYSTDNGTAEIIGSQDPPQQGPCAPCYKVGSFRDWATSYSFGESYVRDSVAITGTNDSSGTNNLYNSGWWYRSAGSSFWPGPTQ